MNNLARLFIKTSLVYLALSTILGVFITIGPGYSFMHSHFAVVGWASFMLFGLAYESIPRYTSRRIFRLIDSLLKHDIDVIHLSSCMLLEKSYAKCPHIEEIKQMINEKGVRIVEGTHH